MYPDGSVLQLSDFALSSQIKTLYGNHDGKTFTLPCLSSFLKMNGTSIGPAPGSGAIAKIAGKNQLIKHKHNVNIVGDMRVQAKTRLPGNPSPGTAKTYGTIHGGNGNVVVESNDRLKNILYDDRNISLKEFVNNVIVKLNPEIPPIKYNTSYIIKFDQLDYILNAIDKQMEHEPNWASLKEEFVLKNTLKLNPI